jgi:Zn-dependent protease with chaperone function
MTTWVLLPLALSALFGFVAPALVRRLPPAPATWLLSAGSLVAAAASSASLGLVALVVCAQAPPASAEGQWSDAVLASASGVPTWAGVLAGVLVIAFAVRFVRAAARRGRAVLCAHRIAAALPAPGGELAVIDTDTRQALAVPGRPGRIVITTGMLRSLDGAQRRALLAHERAHLARGHHWHQSAAALARAANPLLWQVPAALELCCERWADEDAAAVSARSTVAAALTRVVTAGRTGPSVVLAAGAGDVAARIGALAAPAPRPARWSTAAGTLLLVAIAIAVAVALHDVEGLFERAQAMYRAGLR